MARMLAKRFACVRITPFGSPVEPEVYCRRAMSLERRARMPVRCAGNAPGAGGGALSAASISFSASATEAREVSAGAPLLPRGERSAADILRRYSKLPTAARRTLRSGRRETADRSARESHRPEEYPRRKQRKHAREAGSAILALRPARRGAPVPPRNAAQRHRARRKSA